MIVRGKRAAGAEGGYKMTQMATAEEVSQKLGTLDKRYSSDLDLYTRGHAHILFLQNGWKPVRNSSWSIAGGESGVIMERGIDSDYCIQMKSNICVAKGPHSDTVYNIDEIPPHVIGIISEALDNMEALMEMVDNKFLEEAEAHG